MTKYHAFLPDLYTDYLLFCILDLEMEKSSAVECQTRWGKFDNFLDCFTLLNTGTESTLRKIIPTTFLGDKRDLILRILIEKGSSSSEIMSPNTSVRNNSGELTCVHFILLSSKNRKSSIMQKHNHIPLTCDNTRKTFSLSGALQ